MKLILLMFTFSCIFCGNVNAQELPLTNDQLVILAKTLREQGVTGLAELINSAQNGYSGSTFVGASRGPVPSDHLSLFVSDGQDSCIFFIRNTQENDRDFIWIKRCSAVYPDMKIGQQEIRSIFTGNLLSAEYWESKGEHTSQKILRTSYYLDGITVRSRESYQNGELDGYQRGYSPEGDLIFEQLWSEGYVIEKDPFRIN